jgi:biotin carboxyl carrier protein
VKYVVRVGGHEHEVSLNGENVRFDDDELVAHVEDIDNTPIKLVRIGDDIHRVVVRPGSARGTYTLWLDGYRFDVEALDERTHAIRELSGVTAGPTGPAPLKAPMPGLIVRVNAQVGDKVQAGQGLVVMEAMKMENELRTQAAGTVKAILASPGTAVEKGAVLIELE